MVSYYFQSEVHLTILVDGVNRRLVPLKKIGGKIAY